MSENIINEPEYRVAVLFFSTSRYEYLFPMLNAFEALVDFQGVGVYKIFIDDYPKDRDNVLLEYIRKTYGIDKMVLNEENLGYSGSWKKAWTLVPDNINYIWHQEDDLVVCDKIKVLDMINMMKNSSDDVCQIMLKRQVVYSESTYDFVREIETNKCGWEVKLNGADNNPITAIAMRINLFISHSGLYPRWVIDVNKSVSAQEHTLMKNIRERSPSCIQLVYGGRNDVHRIDHIGIFNRGQKVSPDDSHYNIWGKYDKDKNYYSYEWLTEWVGSRNYELAQLHKQYGNNEGVIKYYKQCIDFDDDVNKKYMACLYLANRQQKEKYEEEYYLKLATSIHPQRAEAWYKLMMLNKKKVAYGYGKTGIDYLNQWKGEEYYMMDKKIYDCLFYFDFCLVAWYADCKQDIPLIASKVTKEKSPPGIYKIHIDNYKFYNTITSHTNLGTRERLNEYKVPEFIVIDNFLEYPEKERDFALAQEYPIVGNYPGRRSKSFATIADKEMFETIIGKKITYWPIGEKSYNGSYQFCTENMNSWIHRDLTTHSAMIYLTPCPATDSGTCFYKHKETGGIYEKDNVDQKLDNDSRNYDAWTTMDTVGNFYNRLVIFNGTRSHKSDKYFGDNIENARLFKIFFFNVEGYQ